jgi:hypothetical protein
MQLKYYPLVFAGLAAFYGLLYGAFTHAVEEYFLVGESFGRRAIFGDQNIILCDVVDPSDRNRINIVHNDPPYDVLFAGALSIAADGAPAGLSKPRFCDVLYL